MTKHTRTIAMVLVVALIGALAIGLASNARSQTSGPLPRAATSRRHFVVWSPEGLPPRVGRRLERVDGVRDAVKARFALDWLLEARTKAGRRVQSPPAGGGYPFEILLVAPSAYAKFVPRADRAAVRHLGPGEVLIPKTEAHLRAAGRGLRLHLRSGNARVAGVVSNHTTQGYEALMARPAPDDWTYQMRYFLVNADAGVSRRAMRRAVESATSSDIRLRIADQHQTRFLRYAASVRPQMIFKKNFGEFAARPTKTGALTLVDGWRDRNITSESVPILGTVTCHRKLFPQLRGAMNELQRKGLSYLIRRDEYAGCFNSRFVAVPAGIRLSRHAWGVAFDINTSNNQFGQDPHQDPRLVRILRHWGFIWGGIWPLPDGMHFEWKFWPNK
ncbi:MAG: hypothetical protein QOH90_513 [Actinomycetota bacterium]|nr:hypothetical protein [Actinomycetota bacterium]